MSKNQELLAKINDPAFLSKKDATDREAALDALLGVDVSNFKAFRDAVIKYQKTFWDISPGSPESTSDNLTETDIFLNSQDTDHSFLKIKQAATTQRVKFSLTLTDIDILLNILKHNPEECRAYLATLENSPLSTINGWQPSVTPPPIDGKQPPMTNSSQDILTDEAIKEIQRLAAAHRALIALDKAPIELLAELEESAKDANKTKFLAAITKLDEELSDPTLIDKDLIWSTIKDKITVQKNNSMALAVKALQDKLRAIGSKDALKLQKIDEDFKVLVAMIPESSSLLPYLTPTDITNLKETARLRRFEIQLQRISYLGAGAHPTLSKIFTQLPAADQRHFMSNYTSSSVLSADYLPRRIINSTNKAYIEHYLPKIADNPLIALLVEENERNSLFSKIYNVEAARILASIQPSVTLSSEQIILFNKALFVKIDFDDVQYIALVKTIVPSKDLYQAFGLNDEGTKVIDKKKQTDINKQNNYNLGLYTSSNDNAMLLKFLFAIRKNADVNESDIKQIEQIFNESLDFKQFFDAIASISSIDHNAVKLNEAILNQISPALFHAIRNDIRKTIFKKNNPAKVGEVLKQVKEELKNIQKSHVEFSAFRKKMVFIFAIDEVHLFNPLFQSKAHEMKRKYKELAQQCDVIVDKLRQDSIALQDAIESMPPPDDATSKAMNTLYAKLNKEIEDIKKQLEFFESAQNKMSGSNGILKAMEAVNGYRRYVYDSKGITTGVIEKEKLAAQGIHSANLVEPTVAYVSTEGEIAHFHLEEQPKEGAVRYFDVHHLSQQKIEAKGRFIYEPSSHTSSKSLNGRFEVVQFPRQVLAKGEKGAENEDALNEARVNFSMAMATQILATMDSPPTKKNPLRLQGVNKGELAYLWTALVILGEKGSKMRFSSDALVTGAAFELSTQKGWFGFTKDSLYNTVFKKHGALVKDPVAATCSQANKRFSSQKAQQNIKGVEKATQFFKGKLTHTKESVEKHKKDEGPVSGSSGPTPSS